MTMEDCSQLPCTQASHILIWCSLLSPCAIFFSLRCMHTHGEHRGAGSHQPLHQCHGAVHESMKCKCLWGHNMHAISSAFLDLRCVELNNNSRKANCSFSWSVIMAVAEILKEFLMFKLLSCILYRPQPVTLRHSGRIPVIKITHMVKAHHLGFRGCLLLRGCLETTSSFTQA